MVDGKPKAVSFNTSFQFQVITSPLVERSYGMAFFIASSLNAPENSDGIYFGLVNDTSTGNALLALEFNVTSTDDPNDYFPDDSSIGLGIGSIVSTYVQSTSYDSIDYPQLYLQNNYTFTVWMSFNAATQQIKVWMTNNSRVDFSSADPPIQTNLSPILTTAISNDLLSNLFKPSMFVGFSATTNYSSINHSSLYYSTAMGVSILKWYFSVDPVSNTTTNSATSTWSSLKIIVPSVAVTVLLLVSVASVMAFLCYRKQQRKRESPADPAEAHVAQDINQINLQRYSYQQLQDCTHNFNDKISLIGEGSFSRVYKGTLPDGSVIAIKRIKEGIRKEAEFATELKVISSIRHRNLLQLQGWSYEHGEALLVYKFMRNGNLENYLFGVRKGTLDGGTRLRILAGVAAALEYLHCRLGECILHRDVKAANVLLTDDFEPVLGDFGLARLIKHNQAVTATRAGTPGFIAPEDIMSGKVTEKSDVYSFGVLMLEVASGSRAISRDTSHPDQIIYLVDLVKSLQQNNNSINNIQQVIDHAILKLTSGPISEVEDQWKQVLELALMCCNTSPEHRPDMKYVSQHIQEIIINTNAHNGTSFPRFKPNVDQNQYSDYLAMLRLNETAADPSKSPDPSMPFLAPQSSYIQSSSSSTTSAGTKTTAGSSVMSASSKPSAF